MSPSLKKIRSAFPHLTIERSAEVKRLMVEADSKPWPEHNRACRKAMEAIDAILGTCGVESIPAGHNSKSPALTYCNTGDTYGTTIEQRLRTTIGSVVGAPISGAGLGLL